MTGKHQRGIGLVEVLIAILVVSLSVVALSRLQGQLLRSGGETSMREVALKLAQAKLDDLRSFTTAVDTGGFDYGDIASNAGGRLTAADALMMPSGETTFDNQSFTLRWAVTDLYLVGGAYTATDPGGAEVAQKRVKIGVGWNVADGSSKTVTLEGYIAPIATDTGVADPGGAGIGGGGPQVYTTEGVAPDVLGLDIGDTSNENGSHNVERETFKPIPDVELDDEVVLVQFDTINFIDDGVKSGEVLRLNQQDALTVGCNCEYNASFSGELELPSPLYLDDSLEEYQWQRYLPPVTLSQAGKQAVGQPNVSGSVSARALDFCTTCCESHFDGKDSAVGSSDLSDLAGATGNPYDELSYGDFQFYSQDSSRRNADRYTDPYEVTSKITPNAAGIYAEACRMQRIDGYYRMMPDWQQIDLQVLPRSYLSTGAVESAYLTHISNVLETYMSCGGYGDPVGFPSGTCAISDTAVGSDADGDGDSSNDLIPKTSTTLTPGTHQLMARAIYMDPVNSAVRSAYLGESGTESNLAALPFNEVNITLFADWELYQCPNGTEVWSASELEALSNGCKLCTDALCTDASITSEPVETIVDPANNYYGTYSRGLLTISATADQNFDYYALVRSGQGNSGLTGLGPTMPRDIDTARASAIKLKVDSTVAGFGGRIECLVPKATGGSIAYDKCSNSDWDSISIAESGNVSCTISTSGSAASNSFTCSYSAWTGQVEVVGTGKQTVGGLLTVSEVKAAALKEDGSENQFCIVVYEPDPDGALGVPEACTF
ncbi:hypothetical protein [Ferrimonas balearica]|uniref:hypothetical protein n=1 Tax=Ferrimonas balearica TaxID=44012 RepID=UPI001C99ED10|nr:hypothetical protein [Ferrimonas balearica]MBY5993427.1 hypothetical protein [Ferrimonas balearica]